MGDLSDDKVKSDYLIRLRQLHNELSLVSTPF